MDSGAEGRGRGPAGCDPYWMTSWSRRVHKASRAANGRARHVGPAAAHSRPKVTPMSSGGS